ncbi:hypothetical protein BpHYR1_053770 [Brachionus plicatilis]|uniref:Uncharacterized protein n=1 Tax=Brachionus plicatilis TaxID=10195 RepID=A0A3M7RPS4_BRAPC|nr:hypothetical protein BpHYR1_053770 [Brachionus plicatilis]
MNTEDCESGDVEVKKNPIIQVKPMMQAIWIQKVKVSIDQNDDSDGKAKIDQVSAAIPDPTRPIHNENSKVLCPLFFA